VSCTRGRPHLNTITTDVGTMPALVLTYARTPAPSVLAQIKPLEPAGFPSDPQS
jgi:hypothetical protein